ncbi:hypothetical protein U14_02435 [Candidatus Moduliflexus flocculans]|uniref:Uncharacterized protein n=1 Tax=Candidatus Moduliflexus flocculans TaxID=1499966 RepID=A0A081BLC7_9BACT|nr:hypothetical protein U14_02435 [Candidatus Moduliflexus flocculans]
MYVHLCLQDYTSREQAHAALRQLAKAFITGIFIPDFKALSGIALRRGAYLLDMFLRLYVRDLSQKQRLRTQLEQVKTELNVSPPTSLFPFYPNDTPGYDQLAHTWGLSNGIRPANVPGLLDLQRRTFIEYIK